MSLLPGSPFPWMSTLSGDTSCIQPPRVAPLLTAQHPRRHPFFFRGSQQRSSFRRRGHKEGWTSGAGGVPKHTHSAHRTASHSQTSQEGKQPEALHQSIWDKECVCAKKILGKLWINSCNCFSYRVEMSHLKRKRGRWIVKWSFQGDRGKMLIYIQPLPSVL